MDWNFLSKQSGKVLLFEDGKKQLSWKITSISKNKLPKKIALQSRGGFVVVSRGASK